MATRQVPWLMLTAFYGEGVIQNARWVGNDLEIETEQGVDIWPDGDVEAVHEAMTRIATDFRTNPLPPGEKE